MAHDSTRDDDGRSPSLESGDTPDPTEGEDFAAPDPVPTRPTFLGEIVQRRAWYLIIPVLGFGFFLAAMPFFFSVERSPYSQALVLHARLCTAPTDPDSWRDDLSEAGRAALDSRPDDLRAALVCLDRDRHKTKFEPVRGRQFGADRAFVLTYMNADTPDPRKVGPEDPVPLRMLFVVEADQVRWDPFGLPAVRASSPR